MVRTGRSLLQADCLICGVAACAALLLLAFRFIGLGDAPFILDEPQFLAGSREQLLTGRVRLVSGVTGTSGILYGPSVYWFYGLVMLVVGDAPRTAIAAMGLILTGGQIFFCLRVSQLGSPEPSIQRRTGTGEWHLRFSVLLLLIAASPHLHLWARLAWDQLTLAVAFVVVALLMTDWRHPLAATSAVGALLGFGVASHPMFVPFGAVAAAAAIAHEEDVGWRHRLVAASLLAGAAISVVAPWLLSIDRAGSGIGSHQPLEPIRVLAPLRAALQPDISYYLGDDWPRAPSELSGLGTAMDALALTFALVVVVFGVFMGLRSQSRRSRHLALMIAGVLLLYPIFYVAFGVNNLPHYQFPVVWAPFAAFALLMAESRHGCLARPPVIGSMILAAILALTVISSRAWLHDNGGARHVTYGPTLDEQQQVVDEACRTLGSGDIVGIRVMGFAHSYRYVASTRPACETKELVWCASSGQCPSTPHATVEYETAHTSRLKLVRGRP